jgi:SAM-dependent methyltransferase
VLYRCRACGFVYGHPREERAAPDVYRLAYERTPPPAPEARYDEWLRAAERRVGRGRLLEVGAGTGALVRVAVRRGWEVVATEVSQTGLARLRETTAQVIEGEVERASFGDASFDLVVSLEVLEHLEEPAAHLREVYRVTRSDGLLLLSTPNFRGLSGRWLGTRWRAIDPQHLSYFTHASLTRLLRQTGYRDVRVRSRSLDVSTWRRAASQPGVAAFDPYASAALRDAVEARWTLRVAKHALNLGLGLSRLGDTLLAWAAK